MSENARWIIGQLGPNAKVLFFAALVHNANASYVQEGDPTVRVPFGAYMKEIYGQQMITIGNMAVEGEIGGCGRSIKLEPMPQISANARFAQLGAPLFFLDLRSAPASATWLHQPSDIWNGGDSSSMVISNSFDLLFFSAKLTPACETRR